MSDDTRAASGRRVFLKRAVTATGALPFTTGVAGGIAATSLAASKIPTQRDELRWDTHQGLVQDWSVQTFTLRHAPSHTALPVRWMEPFLPGEGLGGAANHWNGHTWRWAEYDPQLRSRHVSRYGKQAIPKDMPLQDWGTTYAEMRPYPELIEKLFGLAGKAGNINGAIQPGGNPFEARRLCDRSQRHASARGDRRCGTQRRRASVC